MLTSNSKPLNPNADSSIWICCQIGAREHYAIPRALHQQGKLAALITDTWIKPNSIFNLLPQSYLSSLRERFHSELSDAPIHTFNCSLFEFELKQKIIKNTGWQKICDRNNWFQTKALKILEHYTNNSDYQITIFAYSYSALRLFAYAKKRGWKTILGQIDPGITEEKIVAREHLKYANYRSYWQPAPSQYWQNWQQECNLADRILVNSAWSQEALQKTGIAQEKIDIVPLAYQPPVLNTQFTRTYPDIFTSKRPLRVLFLGQIILRKGIANLLQAIKLIKEQPIELWLVGSLGIMPPKIPKNSQIKWLGAVSRSNTIQYYQQADVFLFPTLSDGFGLTQLEAQAWQLPIIASQYCGTVVKHQINGLILPDITATAIANALIFCLQNPQQLRKFASHSCLSADFSLKKLSYRLQAITHGCT